MDHIVTPSACPTCGEVQDGAAEVMSPRVPKPGDLAVCWDCGSLNVYGQDMHLRSATMEEFNSLPAYTRGVIERVQQERATIKGGRT